MQVVNAPFNRVQELQGFLTVARRCADTEPLIHTTTTDVVEIQELIRTHGVKGTIEKFSG